MKKRLISIITALALCLSLCPIGAFAADDTMPTEISIEALRDLKVASVKFTNAYKEKLDKEYDGKEADPPAVTDLLLVAEDGTEYKLPAGTTDDKLEYSCVPTWKKGAETVSAPKDAGSYRLDAKITLVIPKQEADSSDPDDTGKDRVEVIKDMSAPQCSFTIAPLAITPVLREGITKPYDGTSKYEPSVEEDSPIDYEETKIIQDDFDRVSFEGTFRFASSKVGPQTLLGTNIKITGEAAGNYKLESSTVSGEAKIIQASAPVSSASPTLTVRNRRAHTYKYALEELLPTLPSGQEYGTITPKILLADVLLDTFFGGSNPVDDGKIKVTANELTLVISEANHDGRNKIAEIVLSIESENFNEFSLTLQVYSDDKTGITITGLEPVSPPYDGTPLLGYAGMPQYSQTEGTAGTEMPEYDASELEHSYVGNGDTDYGPTAEPPTEPGTYTVTLSIPETDGDFTGSWTSQFTITKAIVTVTAMERKIKVDDPVPDLSRPVLDVDYTVTGLAEGDELKFPPTMKYATVADSISDGEFEILIDGAMVPDMDHYNPAIKYVSGKLIVTSLSDKDENPFSDVSEYAWYVTAVKYVYNEGLMKGTTNTLFSPTSNITRGMMVTILYRMEGEPKVWSTNPFTDVDEDEYYYDAIRWANSEHIVQGYGNGRFGPNDALTREQLAIIFYNYSRYNAVNVNKAASLDRFVDAKYTSPAGYRALQWACAEKLIHGTGSTTLSPNAKALRAQVAVILMRYRTSVAPPPAKPEETPPEV